MSHICFLSNDLTRKIQAFSYWVTNTIIRIKESKKKNSDQEVILRQNANTGDLQCLQKQKRPDYKAMTEHTKNETDLSDLQMG